MRITTRLLIPLIFASIHAEATAQRDGKPNFIVIYTDDHGWPDIGVAGINADLRTPHLDKLAAAGVYATSGYSSAPQCVPSRAGLLIGKSQNRFGVEANKHSLKGFDAELTIAERLKKAGYATGQIGKWHLGPTNEITKHGFDDVYAKAGSRPFHANFTLGGKRVRMQRVDDDLYHLDACSQAARVFIERHKQEPFFLYLAYRAPHVPLDAPKKYLSRFPGEMPERRRQALAMISAMDDGIGLIRQALSKHELEKNTLIFYIGDNGAPLKIHKLDAPGGGPGWDGSLNAPMNGEKGMLSEGGIRVPFVVAWPGTIQGGQVYRHPIVSLDVAATAVELAGLPDDKALDGVNLLPFLTGEKKGVPHESIRWRWLSQAAIRAGNWKFLKGGKREYLFDLGSDPGEKRNLRTVRPEIAAGLRARLSKWADEMTPPGLQTMEMSAVWEQYFDFYLDGRPAPKPAKTPRPRTGRGGGDTRGWSARGASMVVRDDAMQLSPARGGKQQRPFIVQSGLRLKNPFKARIRFSTAVRGKLGLAWRLEGQKRFVASQVASTVVRASSGFQDVEIDVPAKGTVIHVRILFPPVAPRSGGSSSSAVRTACYGPGALTTRVPNRRRGRRSPGIARGRGSAEKQVGGFRTKNPVG